MRRFVRQLKMGLATVLGIKRLGFFIPYRYAEQIPGRDIRLPYAWLETHFKKHEGQFEEVLTGMIAYSDTLQTIGTEHPPAPRWKQDWFPGLDGAIAYTMTRTFKPKRIVEVGSGHSTRFMMQAVNDGQLDTQITAIDPAPRADITNLPINVIMQTVQDAGLTPFKDLQSGDILSIDSSHILMPGSDVDMLFNCVLPMIPQGVIVHIHDIFLPDDYPADWEWRGYNEQLAAAPLIHGNGYELLWASHYVRTRMEDRLKGPLFEHIKPPEGGFESSLWLCKKSNT